MRTKKELIKDLSDIILPWEIQHIVVNEKYEDGTFVDNGVAKYFWDVELSGFLDHAMLLYKNELDVLSFSAILSIEHMIKDYDSKCIRFPSVFATTTVIENLKKLKKEYEKILREKKKDNK